MRQALSVAPALAAILAAFAPSCTSFAAPSYSLTTFVVPNAYETFAYGINDAGQVVGTSYIYTGFPRGNYLPDGFVFNSTSGSFTVIDPPAVDFASASGINNFGQVVGSFFAQSPAGALSFRFDPATGSYTILNATNSFETEATGINDSGVIVGYLGINSPYNGFVRDPTTGSYTYLVNPLQVNGSVTPLAINNIGQVVGYLSPAGNPYAGTNYGFIYDTNTGTYTILSDPNAVAVSGTIASGINDLGQVIGNYSGPAGRVGFLYESASGSYTDLNDPTLIGQNVIGEGINDAGQIVGYAVIPSDGFTPSVEGFIATPLVTTVPEPASLALLGAVTGCVWLSRSRLGGRRCESAGRPA